MTAPQLEERGTEPGMVPTANNGNPRLLAKENSEFLNSLQVFWAKRFVYAMKKDQLDMPIDMLETNPDLKNGPRIC